MAATRGAAGARMAGVFGAQIRPSLALLTFMTHCVSEVTPWLLERTDGIWNSSGDVTEQPFRVLQYNMLASYLGKNTEPWFLLPLNISGERRDKIFKTFYTKENGTYVHNFADGFDGHLNPQEQTEVIAHNTHFQWETRRPKIFELLQKSNADLISVVEMDRFDEANLALNETYDSAWHKRPRKSSLDGSSLFWSRSRFEAVCRGRGIILEDRVPGKEWHLEDRSMLMVALRDKTNGRVIVVASVHLMRNPEEFGRDPMRMLEVSQMMRGLTCFSTEVGASGLIIMGDFNAEPNSFTYLFMLHGWQDCPRSAKNMQDAFKDIELEGKSGYGCTTKTGARTMWIDYIFFSGSSLELVGKPKVDPCPKGPIPDDTHPSDHMPVSALLRFRSHAPVCLANRDCSGVGSKVDICTAIF